MTEHGHERDMQCVLNNLGECLAKIPEACQCKRMPELMYLEARKRFDGESNEKREG